MTEINKIDVGYHIKAYYKFKDPPFLVVKKNYTRRHKQGQKPTRCEI